MKRIRELKAQVARLAARTDDRPLCERCRCEKCVRRRSMTSSERHARHEELMAIARARAATAARKGAAS